MTMNRPPNPLIAELAGDLQPVRPIRLAHGMALVAVAAAAPVVGVDALESRLPRQRARQTHVLDREVLSCQYAAGEGASASQKGESTSCIGLQHHASLTLYFPWELRLCIMGR